MRRRGCAASIVSSIHRCTLPPITRRRKRRRHRRASPRTRHLCRPASQPTLPSSTCPLWQQQQRRQPHPTSRTPAWCGCCRCRCPSRQLRQPPPAPAPARCRPQLHPSAARLRLRPWPRLQQASRATQRSPCSTCSLCGTAQVGAGAPVAGQCLLAFFSNVPALLPPCPPALNCSFRPHFRSIPAGLSHDRVMQRVWCFRPINVSTTPDASGGMKVWEACVAPCMFQAGRLLALQTIFTRPHCALAVDGAFFNVTAGSGSSRCVCPAGLRRGRRHQPGLPAAACAPRALLPRPGPAPAARPAAAEAAGAGGAAGAASRPPTPAARHEERAAGTAPAAPAAAGGRGRHHAATVCGPPPKPHGEEDSRMML